MIHRLSSRLSCLPRSAMAQCFGLPPHINPYVVAGSFWATVGLFASAAPEVEESKRRAFTVRDHGGEASTTSVTAAQDLIRGTASCCAGRGEHHDATAATCELCSGYGRTCSLRLHFHAETKKNTTNGYLAASGAGRTSAQLFCSRRRKGR